MSSVNKNTLMSKTFNYHTNQVKVFNFNNHIWFYGNDVALVLGYKNLNDAILRHTNEYDRKSLPYKAYRETRLAKLWGKNDYMPKILINEPGVYKMIFGSRLPSANKFEDWVTYDVLPSIRKTGSYQKPMSLTDRLLKRDKEEIALLQNNKKQQKQIIHLTPLAKLGEVVRHSVTNITVNQMAKLIKQYGFDTGSRRLYKWLRNKHLVCSSHSLWNTPSQYSLNQGLLKSWTKRFCKSGNIYLYYLTVVTPKGQQYIVNHYIKENN